VPVYTEFYRWLGWGERIQPSWMPGTRANARRRRPRRPWEAIEQMFIFGSPEEMKERLEAFVAGGITVRSSPPSPARQLAGMIDAWPGRARGRDEGAGPGGIVRGL